MLLVLVAIRAWLCSGACVEVDSDTEAVVNEGFKLGCISCKMRGEVQAEASVEWYFRASGETEFTELYYYKDKRGEIQDLQRFEDRLAWHGSKNTLDLQDGSIYIRNVTYNDTGTYRCVFLRTLIYSNNFEYEANASKTVHLHVVPKREPQQNNNATANTLYYTVKQGLASCLGSGPIFFLFCQKMVGQSFNWTI